MKIEQIYTGCLSEAAYYIESDGEAAIIDPLRETAPYLRLAQKNNSIIRYIFETHFHADFVSGHIDLSEKTGAKIVYGPLAETSFKSYSARDNEEFQLGKIRIRALHTPGHTPESTTYLLLDESGKPHAIFTGDTLFIGDVGRPDLAVEANVSKEDLAGMLYDSLHNKIMKLPDDVIIYPAHGAGSACGKKMSNETTDLLGNQKKTNYALQLMSKEEFITKVTDGILPPPQYFAKNALMNKTGYESIDEVMERGMRPLDPAAFEEMANHYRALILDTRDAKKFAERFIPGSINIGLDGQFAPWVGALITDLNQPILLVTEAGKEEETLTRLSRVGYDNTLGYLQGGMDAWVKSGMETDNIEQVSAEEFMKRRQQELISLDVRKADEYEAAHLPESISLPLDYINDWIGNLDRSKTYYINCAGGYRSMIAASILKSRGYQHIVDIAGGFKEIARHSL